MGNEIFYVNGWVYSWETSGQPQRRYHILTHSVACVAALYTEIAEAHRRGQLYVVCLGDNFVKLSKQENVFIHWDDREPLEDIPLKLRGSETPSFTVKPNGEIVKIEVQ